MAIKALYRFNNTLNDSSGNGYNLSEIGSGATYIPGPYNKAIDQNTYTNYFKYLGAIGTIGASSSDPITISILVKEVNSRNIADTAMGYVSYANITTNVRYGIARIDTRIAFIGDHIGGGGVSATVLGTFSTYVSTTKFSHLVLTYDGTNTRGYVDGVLLGFAPSSGNGVGYAGAVTGLGVGNFQGWDGFSTSYTADAIYGELIIDNTAWSPSVVKNEYLRLKGFF